MGSCSGKGVVDAGEGLDGPHRAVDDEGVEPRVVVGVEPRRAEAGVRQAGRPEPRLGAPVGEEARAVVDVERVRLGADVGHEQVAVAVAVDVAHVDPHARLRRPDRVDGHPGEQRVVPEAPPALVHPQLVGLAVVGDVDVDQAVRVQVRGDDAEGGAVGRVDAGLGRHVGEGAVAAVPIEAIGLIGIALRGAVARLGGRRPAPVAVSRRVVDVVADVEVEPAVVIRVDEGGRHPPEGVVGAAGRADVGERAVAVVPEELVGPLPRSVEVGPAVVVEVAGGHPHAVGADVEAAPRRHVGEAQRAGAVGADLEVVAVEAVGQRPPRRRRKQRIVQRPAGPEHLPLKQVDVEVAVVVEVEQGPARAEDLVEVVLAGHAVEMDEVDARRRPVREPRLTGRGPGRGGRIDGSARCGSRGLPAGRREEGQSPDRPSPSNRRPFRSLQPHLSCTPGVADAPARGEGEACASTWSINDGMPGS